MTNDLPLYAARLVELARHLPPPLPLKGANARAKAHAKLCGSTIEIETRIENGFVMEIAGTIDACALGKAATGIAMAHIPGLTLPEIQQAKTWLQAILKGDHPALPPEWQDLQLFEAAKDIPMRHASVQLIFTALEGCYSSISIESFTTHNCTSEQQ